VDYDLLDTPDCPEIVKTNYEHWQKLIAFSRSDPSEEGVDSIVTLNGAYEQTQQIYTKEVRPTPSFRGYLYLGRPEVNESFLAISINLYLRTKEVRLPSSTKVSAISKEGTKKVQMVSTYLLDVKDEQTNDTMEIEVNKADLLQGFKFGKSTVIVSEEEMAAAKLKTHKEMSIIGFLDADKV
jgi:hypothetical protein